MKQIRPKLSLIIPVFNEEKRLAKGIKTLESVTRRMPRRFELIVVDDGSLRPQQAFLPKTSLPIDFFRLFQNRGKGAAIAEGVKRARGEYIVFCDIDFSVPPEAIIRIVEALSSHDIAIASRRLPGSVIATHQPIVRELSGRIFTFLSNVVCDARVADVTCGCKGFRASVAKRLFSARRIDRWVFDTEILFLARKWGYRIAEVPVVWRDRIGTKVKPWDLIGSFIDLFKIRWYSWKGEYVRFLR